MRFGSVCSGIEAASVAWEPLGWQAAWVSEIEPFPSAVLAHHYPDTPNLGDMTTLPDRILSGEVEAPDVFCGGTPCQAFSVAGLRRSLDDARGNLSLTFCEIANAIDFRRSITGMAPAIVFWENVPGVLSTNDNAFGCFLAGLAGEDDPLVAPGGKWSDAGVVLGPQRAVAWRILDAQYFGLAQRRRRVFVVASAQEGFDPAAVLFEWDGVRRDTAPSREAGQGVANALTDRADRGGTNSEGQRLIPQPYAVGNTLTARQSRAPGDPCHTLARANAEHAHVVQVAQPAAVATLFIQDDTTPKVNEERAGCLRRDAGGEGACVMTPAMQVRRLTPVECERLQGFPDGYTAIPWRNKPADQCPDGPRYKALGNSWAVPVVRWIGARIARALSPRRP